MSKNISCKNRKGQAMGLTVMVLLAICLFSFMIVNFFQVTYWRMKMQNAADAAALSHSSAQARALNAVALINNSLNLVAQRMELAGFECITVEKRMVSTFKTLTKTQQALVKAASGGFLSWLAKEVAKQNGADKCGYPVGGYTLKLKAKIQNVYIYKWVKVPILGTIPVPWSPFVLRRYNPVYYMRTWKPDVRKAQPTHKCLYTVTKKMEAPFAGGFLGIKKPKDIKATARAEVWLDLKPDLNQLFHNGGFPRTKESLWSNFVGIQSLQPAFNARLTPVPVLQH